MSAAIIKMIRDLEERVNALEVAKTQGPVKPTVPTVPKPVLPPMSKTPIKKS